MQCKAKRKWHNTNYLLATTRERLGKTRKREYMVSIHLALNRSTYTHNQFVRENKNDKKSNIVTGSLIMHELTNETMPECRKCYMLLGTTSTLYRT